MIHKKHLIFKAYRYHHQSLSRTQAIGLFNEFYFQNYKLDVKQPYTTIDTVDTTTRNNREIIYDYWNHISEAKRSITASSGNNDKITLSRVIYGGWKISEY